MTRWHLSCRWLPGALAAAVLSFAFAARPAAAQTAWAQFRGPNRDGISPDRGLLQQWPEGGPKLLWSAGGLGTGYSGVAVVGSRIYTMGDLADGDAKAQFLIALDAGTQQKVWTTKVGPPHSDGPRCTPTVDGDRVYAVGTSGDVVCISAADGKEIWRKNFGQDFGGKMMSSWAFSESPLVDGDRLVCTPGAPDAAMVALSKRTGDPLWKCEAPALGGRGKDGAGYSSIVVSTGAGVRQYVQMTGRGVFSARAEDGKFLWGYNRVANGTANISSPLIQGDLVFCSTGYNTGSALLKLSPTGGGGVKADEVYFLPPTEFQNHHGGMVLLNGYVYGGHGHNQGAPACVELATGKVVWKGDQLGTGSAAVCAADGLVVYRYQKDEVYLLEASPTGCAVKGTFVQPKLPGARGMAWAHPAVVGGKLYLRHADALLCYDVKGL